MSKIKKITSYTYCYPFFCKFLTLRLNIILQFSFLEDEETNACVISINDEKGQRQNANRKSICTFCLSEVKKKKTVLFKKTCQNTESSAGVTTEQGNLSKGIDKKTSRGEVIEPIKRAFPRFSSQQHTFCKETKCSDFFFIFIPQNTAD